MKTPHKHAALIKAWADGAKIEVLTMQGWLAVSCPGWGIGYQYRIKPESKPDVVKTCRATASCAYYHGAIDLDDNLKLTFDGETGDLKAAEVLAFNANISILQQVK
jgi:hypothetical protein